MLKGYAAAAAKGHLPVIEFLTSLGIIEIGSALERAALAGHLDVLDFLQQNTIATCTSQVMDGKNTLFSNSDVYA